MRRFLPAAFCSSRFSSLPPSLSAVLAVAGGGGGGVGKRGLSSLYPQITGRTLDAAEADSLVNEARDLQLRVRRLYNAGEFGPAIDSSVKLIELSRNLFGDKHVAFASALNNFAAINSAVGDVEKAGQLYEYAITVYRQAVGELHRSTLTAMQNLALSFKRQSRFKESENLLLKIRLLRTKTMGGTHAEVTCTTLHLAALYHQMGRLDLASSLFELSLPLMEQHEAVCPSDVATAQYNFALLRKSQKQFDEAKTLFLKALEYRREHYGLKHPLFEQSVNSLLSLYTELGDTEAIDSLKSSLPDKWKPLN